MSFWSRILRALPYHAAFLGSLNHAWLALVTLGIGVAVATPLSLFLGVGAYGLGVIFLPDLPVFRRGVDEKRQGELTAQLQADLSSKGWPRYVRVAPDLPATATNKVLKRELISQGPTAGEGVLWVREERGTAYAAG